MKTFIVSTTNLFITWIRNNRFEFFVILLILAISAFMRLYKIDQYMNFRGDEGRDALMVKRILVERDIPLIGPTTSIGNIYLGPLYYYMMSIPMAIVWLNPVAAAVQVALIGVATVAMIYFLARVWFGKLAAASAAVLYSLSPVNIVMSRSSWNPHPAPFFALLSMIGLYKIHRSGNFLWFILTAGALAFAVQMHYLVLILVPITLAIWLLEIIFKKLKKNVITGTLLGVAFFLFLMSPLVVFDFKHNFLNYRALTTFFTERQTTVNLNPLNALERIIPIYNHDLVGRYITGENMWLSILVSVLILTPFVVISWKRKANLIWPYLTLGVWLILGVLGLALYKQNVYDHYLGFLNPAPYLLLGSLFLFKNIVLRIGLLILIGILLVVNLQKNPLQYSPNNQLQRTKDIAQYVLKEAGEEPFNFALIAKDNYDPAYQFYLEMYGHKPKQPPYEITDQLFVVCEDPECQPVGHHKYEIAAFGWTKIEQQSEFHGVKVFKLIHNPTGQPQ